MRLSQLLDYCGVTEIIRLQWFTSDGADPDWIQGERLTLAKRMDQKLLNCKVIMIRAIDDVLCVDLEEV